MGTKLFHRLERVFRSVLFRRRITFPFNESATDGVILDTIPLGTYPVFAAFDGENVWVTIYNEDEVTKIRASDDTVLGTFPVGDGPEKLVTLLLIEAKRLGLVGVEPGANPAALAGGSFRAGQDARAEILSSELLRNNEQFNDKPIVARLAP